jgi:hypothetical protein
MMHDFKNLNVHDPDNLARWSKPILPWYKKIWEVIKLSVILFLKIMYFATAPFIAVVSIYAFVVIVFLQ